MTKRREIFEDRKTAELFEDLPAPAYQDILSAASPRKIACGEALFCVGDPIKEIFLLTEGRVKLTQVSQTGSESILRLHIPGQIVGSFGFMSEGAYGFTGQALDACKTLVWTVAAFQAIFERFPVLYSKAQDIVARQIYDLSCRICEISTRKAEERLAYGMFHLLGQIGRRVHGNFELDVTQETLAQMTAMTFSTVNRQLSKWEQLGLVKCRRNTIVIRDSSSLTDFCNFGSEQEFRRDPIKQLGSVGG